MSGRSIVTRGYDKPSPHDHGFMDFPQVWPHLTTSSRSWLMEHNGEPVPDDLIAEILSVTGGEQNPQWWAGPSVEGGHSSPTRRWTGSRPSPTTMSTTRADAKL